MEKCIFCELSKIIKDREIINNKLAMAFLTNRPIVPGHTLIIPIRCTPRYEELNKDEMEAIEELRKKVIIMLRKYFKAEGFNFSWNDGEMAGQSVAHFHLHIIPRKTGDTGITKYDPREFLYRPSKDRPEKSEKELKEMAQAIKNI